MLDELRILRSRAHEFIHDAHQFSAFIVLRWFRPRFRNTRKFGHCGCEARGATAMPRHCSIHYLSNKAPRLWLASHGKGALSRRVVDAPKRGGEDVVCVNAGRSPHFHANPSPQFRLILQHELCDLFAARCTRVCVLRSFNRSVRGVVRFHDQTLRCIHGGLKQYHPESPREVLIGRLSRLHRLPQA